MTKLIKSGAYATDSFTPVDDDAALPDGAIIVSLARFEKEREHLLERNTPLGVRLKSDQNPELLGEAVGRLSLVVLEFPKFRDGRAFSTARELRERYGYGGEIRAIGHLIPDQYQFLTRTGFTSVEIPDGVNLESWRLAFSELTIAYQAGTLDDTPLAGLRRHVVR